jgi:ribosomal protein S18 acetylase RimI-like enzyme
MDLAFVPATEADLPYLLDLSIRVLRADLERVGRFDPARRERRLRAVFDKGGLCLIRQGDAVRGDAVRGCAQAVHHPDHLEIASLYLEPEAQGRGLGRRVVTALLAQAPGLPARLEALKGAAARAFWERMGFVVTGEAGVDWHMEHPPRA